MAQHISVKFILTCTSPACVSLHQPAGKEAENWSSPSENPCHFDRSPLTALRGDVPGHDPGLHIGLQSLTVVRLQSSHFLASRPSKT